MYYITLHYLQGDMSYYVKRHIPEKKLEKVRRKCNLNIFSDETHKLFAKNLEPDLVASFWKLA